MTCKYIDRILIGIMAINVDDRGYLQPPTNGDIGDRMFGI
jgi:uracil phosphoribosyltransferase